MNAQFMHLVRIKRMWGVDLDQLFITPILDILVYLPLLPLLLLLVSGFHLTSSFPTINCNEK